MKRSILFLTAMFVVICSYAQGEMDAIGFSRNDMTGTARAMGMGGAFGALGGDITGVAINPGGIGVYRSSEFVATMNFENVSEKSDLSQSISESKFKFNFDNIAYVGYFPTSNDVFQSFNLGFSYNRLKNYDRRYKMSGTSMSSSLTEYIATKTNSANGGSGILGEDLRFDDNDETYNPFDHQPWLSVLAYNADIITPNFSNPDLTNKTGYESSLTLMPGSIVNNALTVEEKGSIGSYDFTFGTNISNILSLGMTFGITDIHHRINTYYDEAFSASYGFSLENWMETEGTGYNLKVGAVIRPIDALRIGIAYHSPTWYNMSDYYSARIDSELDPSVSDDKSFWLDSPESYADYNFHTPYKWVFSVAGIIGTRAIVSVDYEMTDYKSMNFKGADGKQDQGFIDQNGYIDEDFKVASTLRAGFEYRISPQFSGRLGYAWMQSPLEAEFKAGNKEVGTVGSIPSFILDGDAHYYTLGFGYRITKNFYVDMALVLKQQEDQLYAFSNIFPSNINHLDEGKDIICMPAKLTNNTFKGLLTFGYKF